MKPIDIHYVDALFPLPDAAVSVSAMTTAARILPMAVRHAMPVCAMPTSAMPARALDRCRRCRPGSDCRP